MATNSLQAAIDFPRTRPRERALGFWHVAAVVALLCALMAALFVQGVTGEHPSLPAVRSARIVNHGLSSLPFAAQAPISAVLGADDAAFQITRAANGLRASNPAQRLQVRFGRSGVLVDSGSTRVGLSVRAIGYGVSLHPLGEVAPRLDGSRVVYARPVLSEWYENGPLGVEQGFTVSQAAAGHSSGPLTLSMVVSGDARASLAEHGQSVALSHAGKTSLRYGSLVAKDASGRTLRSWLTLSAGRVLLRVDTRGARYPLRIDPMIQQGEKITGTGETGSAWFGFSVALSANGKTALIGGPYDNSEVGAAWVFTRAGSTWTQQGEKLTGSGETGAGFFGDSVALSANGNTALIGGYQDNSNVGAAWVFTRSGTTWTQQGEKLKGEGEVGSGAFGDSVSLSADGNTALIGGPTDNKAFHQSLGAAWVFTRSGSTWTQSGAKLTGSEESSTGVFGFSVALSGNGKYALIGGRWDGPVYTYHRGAAWVFELDEGTWVQDGSKISEPEVEGEDEFGYSVAISNEGNTALIGAPEVKPKGAAFVYTRSGEAWTKQRMITPVGETGSGSGHFGSSVALSSSGNTALVGARFAGESSGDAFLFAREENAWFQEGPEFGGTEDGKSQFGASAALSSEGSTALIGGPTGTPGAAWGFTYVFSPEEQLGLENEAEPHRKYCLTGHPVNCATGNLAETQTDLSVGGRGPGLHVVRSYNSRLAINQTSPGPFGYGWTGPYCSHLAVNEEAETATVYQENGSTVPFELTSSKTYVGAGIWVQATLVKEGSTYIYTLPDQSKLDFNSSGQLTSESDRNGNTITLQYAEGRLESVTDEDGRKLTFTYNGEGQVGSVKDPMGHTVKYTYESGNLISVTQPGEESLRWQFKYNLSHDMTSETDGRGHAVTTEYDGYGRAISQTDAMERKRTWKYATSETGETETTITEPNGSTTVEQFNIAELPVSITRASGTAIAQTTTYEYDANYNLIASTDANKHTTKYGYNAAGDRTSETDPNSDETKWTYNSRHEIETTTTPKGEKTTIKRDSHGNPEVLERPAPASKTQKTTYKYNSHGDLTSETNPLEHTRTFEYDAAGDRTVEIDAESDKRTWGYNEDSQETSMVSPKGNVKGVEASKYETKTERDAQGRPIKITDPLGHTTKRTYDGDGNLETLTDANSHTTTYSYDADNELTATKEPNGAVTETEYDKAGQTTARTDGNKHTTKYERNLLEQVTEVIDPLSRKTIKEYDAAGNPKKLTDPEKRVTTLTYDSGNRLKEITYSDGKTHSVKYEYDKDSDRTKMIDGTGTTTYTFDQLDRLTESKDGHGNTVKYEYDLANEPTKITYPNAKAVTRAYDKAGRLEKITDWLSNVTKFTYDPNSNLTATTFPTATGDEDKYAYNEANQMSEVKMAKGSETLASLVYTRDNDGQLKKTTSKGLPGEETLEDTYDENNRLTKGGSVAYEYDAANNATKIGASTYSYDKADELEKGTGLTFAFDELGERTKSTPSGAATAYGYNEAGDLTTVERPEEGKTPKIEDSYAYDGNGLRTSQTMTGKTSYLAWELSERIPLLLNDGTNSYVYGAGNHPIEQISSAGAALYLHHDQQGSTRMLTGTTGKSEATVTYDAYGNTTGTAGTVTTPLGYDGQYTNTNTGLIYLRARAYDPKTAQFLTVDPMASVTREPYAYANDNPLNTSDPTGTLGQPCETQAEWQERLERLRLLEEQVAKENSEERRKLIIEEYEEITIAWGKGVGIGIICFPLKWFAGVCEAGAEPEQAY